MDTQIGVGVLIMDGDKMMGVASKCCWRNDLRPCGVLSRGCVRYAGLNGSCGWKVAGKMAGIDIHTLDKPTNAQFDDAIVMTTIAATA